MSERKIVVPPDIQIILNKPGKGWTGEEIMAVFEWLMDEPLDAFIRFAFGFTRNLESAEYVVRAKIGDAFRHIGAYDPARYRGRNDAFLNWLYKMIARAAFREVNRSKRRQARPE
jgi:DNA-directed RNA polymerase specialized sigma24 family protein